MSATTVSLSSTLTFVCTHVPTNLYSHAEHMHDIVYTCTLSLSLSRIHTRMHTRTHARTQFFCLTLDSFPNFLLWDLYTKCYVNFICLVCVLSTRNVIFSVTYPLEDRAKCRVVNMGGTCNMSLICPRCRADEKS